MKPLRIIPFFMRCLLVLILAACTTETSTPQASEATITPQPYPVAMSPTAAMAPMAYPALATDTAVPMPPATATLLPTPTPTVAATAVITACPGAPPILLSIGKSVMVSLNPPIPSRVRELTRVQAKFLGQIAPGETVTVTDGPRCADGYTWWKVQSAMGLAGWTVEGDNKGYWLVTPATIPASTTPEERLVIADASFGVPTGYPLGSAPETVTLLDSDGSHVERPELFSPYTTSILGGASEGSTYIYVDLFAWAPNGQSLAFMGFAGTTCRSTQKVGECLQLYLANLNSGKVVRLTTDAEPYHWSEFGRPTWSPDSRQIVIAVPSGLVKIDVESLQRHVLTANAKDMYPRWSPDGKVIAFVRQETTADKGQYSLMMMQPDGSGVRTVTSPIYIDQNRWALQAGPDDEPAWSPDSRWLAYEVGQDHSNIEIANVTTGEKRMLVPSSANDFYPVWSPDGTRLAFVSDRGGQNEIYVVSLDSQGLVNLMPHKSYNDIYPLWSPSGRLLAFMSDRYGRVETNAHAAMYKLLVLNVGTGAVSKVSDSYVFSAPAWQPHP